MTFGIQKDSCWTTLANSYCGVQDTSISFSERMGSVPTEVAFGSAMMFGLPVVGKMASKPYSVWCKMNQMPGMTYSQAWQADTFENDILKKAKKHDLKNLNRGENNIFKKAVNRTNYSLLNQYNLDLMEPEKLGKDATTKQKIKFKNQTRQFNCYKEAKDLIAKTKDQIKNGQLKGDQLKQRLKDIRALLQKGDVQLNNLKAQGAIKSTSKLGKATHWLKSKTGYYKAKGAVLKSARGASALKMAGKCVKGAGVMAVIGAVMEAPDVIGAFGLGAGKGFKQLGKSAVKVGASVGGYIAGAAAAGAIAGSVFPDIGNVVGGIIGFVGGCIGAAITSFAADKIVGKSEVELAKEEEAKKLAAQAENSQEARKEFVTAVGQNAEAQGGFATNEELKAYEQAIAQVESEYNLEADLNGTASSEDPQYTQEQIELKNLLG